MEVKDAKQMCMYISFHVEKVYYLTSRTKLHFRITLKLILSTNKLLQLCTARTVWSKSVIKPVSVRFGNYARIGLLRQIYYSNGDQYKPKKTELTNEKQRKSDIIEHYTKIAIMHDD